MDTQQLAYIHALRVKIDDLEAKMLAMEDSGPAEISVDRTELRNSLDQLERDLERIENADTDSWHLIKEELEIRWVEVQNALSRLAHRFVAK